MEDQNETDNLPTNSMSKWNYRFIIFNLCFLMIVNGIAENIKSVTYPLIKNYYKLSSETQGLIVGIAGYGYTLMALGEIKLVQMMGTKSMLLSGIVVLLIATLGIALIPVYYGLFATLFLIYVSFGILEVSYVSITGTVFAENTVFMMGILNFFYGVGSVASPNLASLIVKNINYDFKGVYIFVACLSIPIFVVTIFVKFNNEIEKEEEFKLKVALSRKLTWYCIFSFAFLQLIEFGTIDWAGLYFQDSFGLDPVVEGSLFATIYFISFSVSGFLSSFWIDKVNPFTALWCSQAITILVLIIGFLVGKTGIYVLPITGASIALNWPLLFPLFFAIFGENGKEYATLIMGLGSATNNLFEFLVGTINERVGPEWGYRCMTIAPFMIGVFATLIYFETKDILNFNDEVEVDQSLLENEMY